MMSRPQVETIGDAYMVVGGLPKPCDNHAEKVAHMALSMMEAARKVLSPVDKEPIKVPERTRFPFLRKSTR